jgi:alkylation response protein AidB-like acyl-CoA dehydrogenase
MADFHQSPPQLANQFDDDDALRALLRRLLPRDVLETIAPELSRFGARVSGEIAALGAAAEAEPPRHVPFDPWGRRIDAIVTSGAWRQLDRISAEEGIVAMAYERRFGAASRVVQLVKLYLFHPSSAVYSCPLAMTDGAARCLELHAATDAGLRSALAHLTSRDPGRFWTSGQWMTERTGGSDVSHTATSARRDPDGRWRLTGTKWFTSATTAQMAMTLARIEGAPAGSAGLSLFQMELRDEMGALRGIEVHRLKDKLGTRALPTAELSMRGTPATMVGAEGQGVRTVATMLNITRLYNACCAVAGMRRAVALAVDYAHRRVAFGRPIADQPLHAETLANLQVEVEGALQLVFHLGSLLGREECGVASDDDRALLRLLTPVVKLFTGKRAIAVASEALEAFGGAGYIEDTGLPRLLRDAQVLSIWEGTTNVLSLDVLRALGRNDALRAWRTEIDRQIAPVHHPAFATARTRVVDAANAIAVHGADAGTSPREEVEAGARGFSMAIARTTAGALLLAQAQWALLHDEPDGGRSTAAALRWCERTLGPPPLATAARLAATRSLLRTPAT